MMTIVKNVALVISGLASALAAGITGYEAGQKYLGDRKKDTSDQNKEEA